MAKSEIDPRFFLPPGVVDLEYRDGVEASSDTPDDASQNEIVVDPIDIVDYDEATGFDLDAPTSAEGTLPPPDFITLVSQTARVNSGGGTVVDVIIDVQNVPGAASFEVRVTK